MWIRKITKRKMQFILIAVITMMAMTILTACISFTLETNQFSKKYCNYENCPMYFAVSAKENADQILLSDTKANQLIDHIKGYDAKAVSDDFFNNDLKIANEGSFFYELEDVENYGYAINIIEGEKRETPKDGEVWISHIFAKLNDVKVGDTFKIGKDKEFKIGAVVNSQLCCSGFLNRHPFYANSETLKEIPGNELYSYLLYSKNESINNKSFEKVVPDEFMQSVIYIQDRAHLALCLAILITIFGGVGISAAIIVLAVSMIIFRYLVRALIFKEYQTIGVYKALGRENHEVKGIYVKAYLVSGLAGVIPGFLLARPLAKYLSDVVLGNVKGFTLTNITTISGVLVLIFIIGMLYCSLCLELKKVNHISPLKAMNLSNLSSEEKVHKSVIRNAHSSLAMAINDFFKRIGTSLFVTVVLTISIYMILMSCMTGLTLSHYSKDREVWENLPAYDCIIKAKDGEKALDFIENSEDIDDFVKINIGADCSGVSIEGTEWTGDEANPMVYDNFTEERYKDVPFKKGRICLERHEIAVSKQFLDGCGKKVGDYLEINNGDKKINFLISGCYCAMIKGGKSFYIQKEDFEELGYDPEFDTVLVFLKENVTYDEFAEKFEKEVTNSKIHKDFEFTKREGDTIGEIANPICIVLIVTFVIFSTLNIINLIHTQNKENRKKYGILKALGFTTGYICRENLFCLTIEYGIAVMVSIVLQEVLSPILFSLACGVPFICKPLLLTIYICVGMYVLIMLIAIIMLSGIKKIKPVELMEE